MIRVTPQPTADALAQLSDVQAARFDLLLSYIDVAVTQSQVARNRCVVDVYLMGLLDALAITAEAYDSLEEEVTSREQAAAVRTDPSRR